MALICPVCSVENREGANFCKNCGSTLSSASPRIPPPPGPGQAGREWATTAPAQLRAPTIPAPLFDIGEAPPPSRGFFGKAPAAADQQTVIVMPGQPPLSPAPPSSSQSSQSSQSSSSRRERSERKKSRVPRPVEAADPPLRKRGLMLWLVLLAVAVLMVVAGWYGFGTRKAADPAEAAAPVVAPAPPAPPLTPEPPPTAPAAPEEPQAPVAEPAAQEPAATVAPAAAPKAAAAARPRKPVVAAPAAAAVEPPAPAAPVVAPPPPAPAAPAEPQALCGDRNFIAKAQCMASQCLKPEFRSHAQCEAVRRQQRIDEEKRNPTLLN